MSLDLPSVLLSDGHLVHAYLVFHEQDRGHRDALARHLAGLVRNGLMTLWDRSQVEPGSQVTEVAARHRAEADLVLVLVTPHLLDDDTLLTEIKSVQEHGQARVAPILVQPADWQSSSLARLPPLPGSSRFIATSRSVDRAWFKVAQQIKRELLIAAFIADRPRRVVLHLLLQMLEPYRRFLFPIALMLLLGGLYLFGDRVLAARTHLLGIADANFEYPAYLPLWIGTQAFPGLLVRIASVPGGGGPERLSALVALALVAVPLCLRAQARTAALLALALPVLGGAMALLVVVSVNHVFLAGEGEGTDVPVLGASRLGDAQYEVASWVSNDTPQNDRRRAALGGSYALSLAAIVVLTALSLIRRVPTTAHARPSGHLNTLGAATYALATLVLLTGAPRAYALARWGGVYPTVEEVDPACDAALAPAVQQRACLLWDVSAGASPQVVMVGGASCPPLSGGNSFRVLRPPTGHSACIVRRGTADVVFAKE